MNSAKMSLLSKKGQTTIPIEIRDLLNLHEGDRVLFEIGTNNSVALKKAPSTKDLAYLQSVEKTLAAEWSGDQDDDL